MKLGTLNAYIDLCRQETIKYRFAYAIDVVSSIRREDDSIVYDGLKSIYHLFKDASKTEKTKAIEMNVILDNIGLSSYKFDDIDSLSKDELIRKGLQSMINFFSEFSFEPNFRFVNSFCFALQSSFSNATKYVTNYFKLIDSQFVYSIIEKMKSPEFSEICNNLSQATPSRHVNTRFKIYYGSQGTGKTTEAMKEADNNCMVCHSAMLPSDLMEDFKFVDGKADFQPSALQKAMTEGKAIVLDEINLLPFESLRFLQSILDGKKEFTYKGSTIKIADDFEIIGTMNLTVNGATYSLPEPLIDRCKEIREFKLTAENLMSAII